MCIGREVDDFHTVDYEALSMLNVSATQELHNQLRMTNDELADQSALYRSEATQQKQRIEKLEAENTELKAENEQQSIAIQNLMQRLEKLEQAAE